MLSNLTGICKVTTTLLNSLQSGKRLESLCFGRIHDQEFHPPIDSIHVHVLIQCVCRENLILFLSRRNNREDISGHGFDLVYRRGGIWTCRKAWPYNGNPVFQSHQRRMSRLLIGYLLLAESIDFEVYFFSPTEWVVACLDLGGIAGHGFDLV